MLDTKIDPFSGAMPGESWSREFGSLPMDKAPATVNVEDAYASMEGILDQRSTKKDVSKLIKAGLSVETLVNSFVTQGVAKGMFNPDVAELVKIPLFFKIYSIVQNRVKNVQLYNTPLNEEIPESSLEGIQERLAPNNEYLRSEEEKNVEKRIDEIIKELDKEKGFMSKVRMGEV